MPRTGLGQGVHEDHKHTGPAPSGAHVLITVSVQQITASVKTQTELQMGQGKYIISLCPDLWISM